MKLGSIRSANEMIETEINNLRTQQHPSQRAAHELALKIEETPGEYHFQKAVQLKKAAQFLKLFQALNSVTPIHYPHFLSEAPE